METVKGDIIDSPMEPNACTCRHVSNINPSWSYRFKKAAELGTVVVALTDDEEIKLAKGYMPELKYEEREEILVPLNT